MARNIFLALGASLSLISPVCVGGTFLLNPSFEVEGITGPSTSFTGISGGGHSAALSWGVFNNTFATTTTELVPSTLPGGGEFMLHITTEGWANGIGQSFGTFGEGPICTVASAWIFVVEGSAFIGTGNGGATGYDVFTTTTGQWELLTAPNGNCPANNFIVYSGTVAGRAEFYVDVVSVEEVICPPLVGDLNGDDTVGFADLLILLSSWGPCTFGAPCLADLDSSGSVDFNDLLILLAAWGDCP